MQEHERERQQWDHEREAHRPYWDQPVRVSPSCSAYGTMEYKARLWNVPPGSDWYQACIGMVQQIHGRTLEKPDRTCSFGPTRDGIWGYWRVGFDEPQCMTSWGGPWDKGCVRSGGVQLVEASLRGQKSEDDEFRMCWTTTGHLASMAADLGFPNDCQQRGWAGGGMVSMWEIRDEKCN
ncbi:hypothetical protein HETIRDRAFT_328004 [Heterobasidion irregulare TC 32-1]|uniref:Uncharacterized protein n=1 Tax=Heterobasidion irregulare (strain TC 32-1) TaxID=747525 RepID=W4JS87_HETIT|nr:uncharacterized protein HETIRDRAFT_328004 [Heterobasidion irregulare TC 32-1]ETW76309.1 hypothetical protein HETIRDRAFT_328004 [Heterobasidion irregulare TC 32-1]